MKSKAERLYYLIYRRFAPKEKNTPNIFYTIGDSDFQFYGWTTSKKTLKLFMQQRSIKKYFYKKIRGYQLRKEIIDDMQDDCILDMIQLRSSSNPHEPIILITTQRENMLLEIEIQRMFKDLCSFDSIPNTYDGEVKKIFRYINIIVNLEDIYAEALSYIGYEPEEINILYDNADTVFDEIDDAYMYSPDNYEYWGGNMQKLRGLLYISKVSKTVVYSLESVIKVLKGEL